MLNIGLVNAIHPSKYIHDTLDRFRDVYPSTRLYLKTGNVQKIENDLISGFHDIVTLPDFERFWAIENDFSYKWIARSYATIVVADKHPLADREFLTSEEILNYNFNIPTYLSNNAYLRDITERFSPYGKIPNTISIFSSAHDMRFLLHQETSAMVFIDSFFDFPESPGIKRIPVIDQKNGVIAVWNKKNSKKSLQQFLMLID